MKFVQTVLRRPVSVVLLIVALVVFGFSSLTGMPLEYMPNMEMPMELVMVMWPGADADSIERLVTESIESECETLTDINTVSSTTYDNYTMIQLQYNYGVNLDDAYSELKAAMDNLAADFPEGCEDPTIMEISMTAQATMSISATSASGADIQSYLEDTVVPALEGVKGVAKVDISGATDEYLRIVLNEAKLEQYGLSINSVASAIAAADFDMPVGTVTVGSQNVALSAYGNIEVGTPDLRAIPIQTAYGQIIHLTDVADYLNLYQEDAESISRYNGSESVLLEITKQDSASTISVCNAVEDVLANHAGTVNFQIISSEADNVMSTLLEVVKTLVTGILLTMAVLMLFFGSWKASLIVGCSMPLSILMAIILLGFRGFSFDLMTGTSLIIAIGMIVDNSIVVLESCMRAREGGMDFREAAAHGTAEMLASIFAGTLTTVVVYIPLAMAEGMSGQMAGPLSWTIALTLLASFISAITVVPLLFMAAKPTPKEDLPINKVLRKIQAFYRRVMPGMLRHPGRVMAGALVILLCSLLLASQLEFVLFPDDYDGSIQVTATFRPGTKLEVMDAGVRELEQSLLGDANFENVTLDLSGNTASFIAYAADTCKRSSEESVELYTQQFQNAVGMDVAVAPTGSSDMASMMGGSNTVDITLVGDDMESLRQGAAQVAEAMAQVPGVLRIENEFDQSRTKGRLVIDAQKAMAAGLSQSGAAMQVNFLLSGMTAATIDVGDQEYDVKLEYPAGKYDDLAILLDRPITTPTGAQVTLSDIASIDYTTTLPSISRQDGQFITTVTATTTDAAKYDAADAIDLAVAGLELPEGVAQGMSAMDKMSEDELSGMVGTLLTGVFLVFLVMALQFNSPRLSVMVMTCIPFSLAGSFGALFLSGNPMSIMGVMGFLMLFGIVVNNGIYLVDGTNELRQTMPLEEALIQAGNTRLRPILMTTLTTVMSMVPLLFSSDSGMGMMKEMAWIIVGGLCASTVLTLFLMPSFYLLIRGENPDGTRKQGIFTRFRRTAQKPQS